MKKPAGYSGTPLVKKLGIKDGFAIQVFNSPKDYQGFFIDFPENGSILSNDSTNGQIDFIHLFAKTHAELEEGFTVAKASLKKNGTLWVSWPKKSSNIVTELRDCFEICD